MFEEFRLSIKRTILDYRDMLWSLFPTGQIWEFETKEVESNVIQNTTTSPDIIQDTTAGVDVWQNTTNASAGDYGSFIERLIYVFAQELHRLETRSWELMNERVPGLSVELLNDHEQNLGLTAPAGATLVDRQTTAHAKMYNSGEVSTDAYWIRLAATFGITITISHEDSLQRARRMGARMGATQPRMGYRAQYALLIFNYPAGTDPAALAALQALANELKRAHSIIYWREQ